MGIRNAKWIVEALIVNAATLVGARSSNEDCPFGVEVQSSNLMLIIRCEFSIHAVP